MLDEGEALRMAKKIDINTQTGECKYEFDKSASKLTNNLFSIFWFYLIPFCTLMLCILIIISMFVYFHNFVYSSAISISGEVFLVFVLVMPVLMFLFIWLLVKMGLTTFGKVERFFIKHYYFNFIDWLISYEKKKNAILVIGKQKTKKVVVPLTDWREKANSETVRYAVNFKVSGEYRQKLRNVVFEYIDYYRSVKNMFHKQKEVIPYGNDIVLTFNFCSPPQNGSIRIWKN